MDVQQHAGRQFRQYMPEQEIHIRARHGDMAGIDHQQVTRFQRLERLPARLLHCMPQEPEAVRESGKVGTGRRIDRGHFRFRAAIPERAKQEARGMTAADLDSAARRASARERIKHGGIEPGKPVPGPSAAPAAAPRLMALSAGARSSMSSIAAKKVGRAASKRASTHPSGMGGRDDIGPRVWNEETAPAPGPEQSASRAEAAGQRRASSD